MKKLMPNLYVDCHCDHAHWIVIPNFAVLMEAIFISMDERNLAEEFGPAWLEYKKKVRWWVQFERKFRVLRSQRSVST